MITRGNFATPGFGIKAKRETCRRRTSFATPVFGIKAKRNGGQLGGLDNLYFKSFDHLPSTQLTAVVFYLDFNFGEIATQLYRNKKSRRVCAWRVRFRVSAMLSPGQFAVATAICGNRVAFSGSGAAPNFTLAACPCECSA